MLHANDLKGWEGGPDSSVFEKALTRRDESIEFSAASTRREN
jgi:hypothetical protein